MLPVSAAAHNAVSRTALWRCTIAAGAPVFLRHDGCVPLLKPPSPTHIIKTLVGEGCAPPSPIEVDIMRSRQRVGCNLFDHDSWWQERRLPHEDGFSSPEDGEDLGQSRQRVWKDRPYVIAIGVIRHAMVKETTMPRSWYSALCTTIHPMVNGHLTSRAGSPVVGSVPPPVEEDGMPTVPLLGPMHDHPSDFPD